MKAINTWKITQYNTDKTIKLFNNKVLVSYVFKGKRYENKYTFSKFLEYEYIIVSHKIDYQIVKEIVKLEKPSDLNESTLRIWDFWTNFDNSNIKEEKIFIDKEKFLYKSKYGFAWGQLNLYSGKEDFYSWKRHDNFFFYGPYIFGVPLEARKRLRKEIFGLIDKKKSKLRLKDAFILFDYNKIGKVEYKKVDGITGIYFKILDGKVIKGGWDNPRDGGENYTSVEYLWYNIKRRLPEQFHNKISSLIKILEAAIVNKNYKKTKIGVSGVESYSKPNVSGAK